jgi:hypothetical protein
VVFKRPEWIAVLFSIPRRGDTLTLGDFWTFFDPFFNPRDYEV